MTARRRLPWPLVFQVLGVAAAVWLVVATWQVWLLVFTALIVAAAILPAAEQGERWRVPRGVTVLAVYIAVAAVLTLMGGLLWPALSQQWQQFMEQLPRLIENVKGWVGDIEYYFGQWGASLPTPRTENVQSLAGTVLANTLSVTTGAVGALFGALAVLVIAAYLVMDAAAVGALLLRVLPRAQRATAVRLAPAVLDRIGGYVRGQLVSSFFVGVLIAIALWLIGVRYPLLIAALAAVFNIVPFVGATLAAVLAVLVALNDSLSKAALALALMIGAQTVEAKFFAPHFVGRATGLHPVAVLLALLGGGHMAGLIGALVAVPLTAGAWEIVRQLYVEPNRD